MIRVVRGKEPDALETHLVPGYPFNPVLETNPLTVFKNSGPIGRAVRTAEHIIRVPGMAATSEARHLGLTVRDIEQIGATHLAGADDVRIGDKSVGVGEFSASNQGQFLGLP